MAVNRLFSGGTAIGCSGGGPDCGGEDRPAPARLIVRGCSTVMLAPTGGRYTAASRALRVDMGLKVSGRVPMVSSASWTWLG